MRWVVSRMKASAVFGLLVIFLTCSGCSHLQRAHDGAAVIEFERQEDNGSTDEVLGAPECTPRDVLVNQDTIEPNSQLFEACIKCPTKCWLLSRDESGQG